MIRLLLLAGGLAAATVATAQERPSSMDMTCGQATALVREQGDVVLGSGGQSFDRFVSSQQFCLSSELTEPAYVPSRDQRQCFVGYRCRDRSPETRGRE